MPGMLPLAGALVVGATVATYWARSDCVSVEALCDAGFCCAVLCGLALIVAAFAARRALLVFVLLCISTALLGSSRTLLVEARWITEFKTWHIHEGSPRRMVRVVGTVVSTPRVAEAAWRETLASSGALREDVLARFLHATPSTTLVLSVDAIEPHPPGAPEFPAALHVSVSDTTAGCRAGDRIRMVGWLNSLDRSRNPGGFDSVEWGRSRGIAAFLRVESPQAVEVLPPASLSVEATLARWRDWIDVTLHESMPRPAPCAASALVAASTTGATWPGSRAAAEPFAACGVQHLVAISGFNFAILAGVVLLIARLLILPRLMVGCALALLATLFIASIEPEVSSVRAALMGVIAAGALSFSRSIAKGTPLAIVALAIVWIDPHTAVEPGFQLSFTAVAALQFGARPMFLLLCSPLCGRGAALALFRRTIEPVAASIAAWSATAPVVIAHFGQCSLLGVPATLLLTPPFALMVISSNTAILLTPISPTLGRASGWIAFSSAECVLAVASRLSGVAGIDGAPTRVAPVEDDHLWSVRLDTIDVGNGSCHLLRTKQSAVLYDGGSLGSANSGSGIVVPALRALGVGSLDAVIISHPNLDHYNALPEVVRAFSVPLVVITPQFASAAKWGAPRLLLESCSESGAAIEEHAVGDRISLPGMLWIALHPEPRVVYPDSNDTSLVMRVETCFATLLFTGDSARQACVDLLAPAHQGALRGITLMELPHHGSFLPMSAALVDRVDPLIVVQSTGARRLTRDKWGELLASRERLVTANDRASAVEWMDDGSVIIGSWDGLRYRWRLSSIVPPTHELGLIVGCNEKTTPDEDRVPDRTVPPLCDLELESPGVDAGMNASRWVCFRKINARDFSSGLFHDHRAVDPLSQRRKRLYLRREDGVPLGNFVEEPFRPPDRGGAGGEGCL